MEKGRKKYSWLSNFHYIYGQLWKFDKKVILFAIAEVLFLVAMGFGAIWMPSKIVEFLEQGNSVATIGKETIALFAGYGLVCAVAYYLQNRNALQYISFRSGELELKRELKTIGMDYSLYESEKVQQIREKAEEAFWGNNWGIEGILHDTVSGATAFLGLLLYAMVLSEVNFWIIAILLVISGIQIVSFRFTTRSAMKQKDAKAKLEVTQEYLNKQAYETNAGKDIRLYQLQNWLSGWYQKVNKKYQHLLSKERNRYFANDLFGLILQLVRDAVCYGYLIYLLQHGMAVSKFVLYIGIVGGFSGYFSNLTDKIMEIDRFQKLVSFWREYMDIPQVFHHGDGEVLDGAEPTIEVEFSHVSFSYPKSEEEEKEKKVLDDISFTMKKGEKVALVGINGAGKSTIVKLICGFYQPQSGHIYLNGIDINDLDLDAYYKDLAVVFQEAFLHSFSIADNISCSTDGNYDKEKCVRVLQQSGLWEKVCSLPKQEQTYLNKDIMEDGIQLSGGEVQKLLLSRGLYKECRLLLLDEPTAALDAIAENEMYQKYEELISGKTTLFISHRLASTRFCDKILFLENGKIIEEGSHETLMGQNGAYAHMFEVQSQYYREGGMENESEECMA